MGIQLISISHKTAPVSIRRYFTFDEENAIEFMKEIKACDGIEEVVVLSTCNRTEIYCSGENDKRNLKRMQELLISKAEVGSRQIPDYIMRYSGENAVHHLFMVAAGLDSALLGENQILGQVKNAFFAADKAGMCKGTFHAMFRMAITAAKEVNTKTIFSKTPVSSASLSLKQMQKEYGSLSGKKMMIIGASGKLGEIILKDALDIEGLDIYITTRQEIFKLSNLCSGGSIAGKTSDMQGDNNERDMPVIMEKRKIHGKSRYYHIIPYKDRYLWAGKCDIIVSATRSPHYTIRKDRLMEQIEQSDTSEASYKESVNDKTDGQKVMRRKRLFFDLAVPQDMDDSIGEIDGCIYYSLEAIEEMARQNNELKKGSVVEAKVIIKKYEEDFLKDEYYRKSKKSLESVMDIILSTAKRNNRVNHNSENDKKNNNSEKNSIKGNNENISKHVDIDISKHIDINEDISKHVDINENINKNADINYIHNMSDSMEKQLQKQLQQRLQKLFFNIKKNMSSEEFKHFLNILEKEGNNSDHQT